MNHEATELKLYIDNNAGLHRSRFIPIVKNLTAKRAKGTYVHDRAIDGFMHLVNTGAQDYVKEHGSMSGPKWFDQFDMKCRRELAEEYAREFEQCYRAGDYAEYVPKKYQPKTIAARVAKSIERSAKRGYTGNVGSKGSAFDDPVVKKEVSQYERVILGKKD